MDLCDVALKFSNLIKILTYEVRIEHNIDQLL